MSKKASIRRSARRRSVLSIIASLLIGSAVLRVAFNADMALATGNEGEDSSGAVMCTDSDTPEGLMLALQEREARVSARETQLADRLQALAVVEAELEEKRVALVEAEASLAATLALADSAAEDDLARLTQVYENMKPEDAAALFTEMDPVFSAGFLARMRPELAAAVMTNLDPELAHIISVVLAGRNATVPTE